MASLVPATPGHDRDRLSAHEQGSTTASASTLARTLPTDRPASAPATMATGHSGASDPPEITAIQQMLSATSGSLLTGLLVTPLDVVRVRLQSQNVRKPAAAVTTASAELRSLQLSTPNAFRPSNLGVTACCREVFFNINNGEVCLAGTRLYDSTPALGSGGAPTCAVEQAQQRTIYSTVDGLRKIARNEGVTTLWRGLSPTLIMAVPANIIYFTGYEWLRYSQESPISRAVSDVYAPLVAGSVARMLAATAVSPIELFRTRLQASHGSSTAGHLADTFQGIREMVGRYGYRSLWRGLALTFWRDVPFSGMYWWGYETIRGKLTDVRERRRGRATGPKAPEDVSRARARRMSQSRENHAETFVDSFAAGAMSGAFASVITMPFDVGKTRTQVYRDYSTGNAVVKSGTAVAAPEERSMVQLLWHIFRAEGFRGLFQGLIPRTLKVAPACAIMISSYEVGKRAFRGMNERALHKDQGQEHELVYRR